MAGDLATMKARIASELIRDDLTVQIANAIADAISIYQSDRFLFNEPTLINEPVFNTVIGRSTYDFNDNPAIKSMVKIDYITYVQGNSTFYIVERPPLDIQIADQGGQIVGPPDEYTFSGQAISLYPVPDNIYPVSIMAHLATPGPLTDNEVGNPWMIDAEQLIRCRAKYEIATHVTRNPVLASAMSPDVDGGPGGKPGATARAWSNLKWATNKKSSLGSIQAMQF
jgi:hypothetical protein